MNNCRGLGRICIAGPAQVRLSLIELGREPWAVTGYTRLWALRVSARVRGPVWQVLSSEVLFYELGA